MRRIATIIIQQINRNVHRLTRKYPLMEPQIDFVRGENRFRQNSIAHLRALGRLHDKHQIWDSVDTTHAVLHRLQMQVRLLQDIEGLGEQHEIVSVHIDRFWQHLLPLKLATFVDEALVDAGGEEVTPQHYDPLDKNAKWPHTQSINQISDQTAENSPPMVVTEAKTSPQHKRRILIGSALATFNKISQLHLQIPMSGGSDWTLQPWHVRTALRRNGIHVADDAQITQVRPDKPITRKSLASGTQTAQPLEFDVEINSVKRARLRASVFLCQKLDETEMSMPERVWVDPNAVWVEDWTREAVHASTHQPFTEQQYIEGVSSDKQEKRRAMNHDDDYENDFYRNTIYRRGHRFHYHRK